MLLNSRRYRDARLVQRTLSGNPEAYGELVQGYITPATAFALSRVRTRADAEEVTQESFVRAFERLDTLREPGKFGPWLFGIVRNCAGRLHERRRTETSLIAAQETAQQAATPDIARDEIFAELRRMIDVLPDMQREIVLLHYFSNQKSREIAAMLEMSPAAVRKQLERARKQLGKQMLEQASGKFECTKDHTKKTIALVAATSAAWMGSRSASAAAATGVTMTAIYKIAIGILLVIAGGALFFANTADPKAPAAISLASAEVEQTPAPEVGATGQISTEPPAAAPATADLPQTSVSAADARFSIVYLVTDSVGNPVPNATVSLRVLQDMFTSGRHPQLNQVLGIVNGTSDLDGIVELADISSDGHAQLTGEIEVDAPGYAGFTRISLSPLALGDQRDSIVVRPTEPMSGTITDTQGQPISGAVLIPIEYESRDPSTWVMSDRPAMAAGNDGRFSTQRLYAGRWRFLVQAPGFAATETEFIETGDKPFNVRLERGTKLRGRIMFSNVPQVKTVRLVLHSKSQYYELHLADTDLASNTFAFDTLRPGTYFLWVDDPNLVIVGEDRIEIAGNSPDIVRDVEITTGGEVTGRLVDAASREGFPGVRMIALMNLSAPSESPRQVRRNAVTDSDGRYRIAGLPRGAVHVLPAGDPSLPFAKTKPSGASVSLEVSYGQTSTVSDIVVERKYSIRGTVVDDAGAPVAAAVVEIRPRGAGLQQAGFRIGADGRFIPADDAGQYAVYFSEPVEDIYLRALKRGFVSREIGPLSVGPSMDHVQLALEPAGSISGRLVGRAGQAEPGPLYGSSTAGPVLIRAGWNASTGNFAFSPNHALGSSTGTFYLGPLPADTYTLTTPGNPAGLSIVLGRGEDRKDIIVSLYAPTTATVEGRVTMLGRPAPKCTVLYRGDQVLTRENGEFLVRDVTNAGVDDDAQVYATSWINGVETRREMSIAADSNILRRRPLLFELARGNASIEGRVFKNGWPAAAMEMSVDTTWTDGATETVSVKTSRDGTYRFDGLPEGANILRLAGVNPPSTDRLLQPVEVNLPAGETLGHDIHLESGALKVNVKGIHAGEAGIVRLIPGSTVITVLSEAVVEQMREAALIEALIERDGMQTIEVFEAGDYVLYVAAYDAAARGMANILATIRFQAVPIEIDAGHITALSVDLDRGASVAEITPMPTPTPR